MRLLLAEDDRILRECIAESLTDAGYAIDCQIDGRVVDSAIEKGSYDALILDIGLPGMSGLEILQRIRARNINIPVLVITARDSIEDRVNGLDIGADDYLTKPFVLAELESRVKSLLRRSRWSSDSHLQTHGDTTAAGHITSIDRSTGQVVISGRAIDLPPSELNLLEKLFASQGRVVRKEELAKSLSPDENSVGSASVEVYIHRLRKRIEKSGVTIKTIRGIGYRLEASS